MSWRGRLRSFEMGWSGLADPNGRESSRIGIFGEGPRIGIRGLGVGWLGLGGGSMVVV